MNSKAKFIFRNQQVVSQVDAMTVNILDEKPIREVLTIEEIRSRYPREWVLIADTESDEQLNVVRGEVLAHSPERDEIDKALMIFVSVKSIAIEYTGPIPQDYTVLL